MEDQGPGDATVREPTVDPRMPSGASAAIFPPPMIETTQLTRRYGTILAVDALDLSVAEGERCALLGPNGAGKSTTILMLTTLLKPTSGTARINGCDIITDPAGVRRSIGVVFQEPSSDDTLTGYENLKLHGMLYGMSPALREERTAELLELVELTPRRNDLVKHYSGGMRRRLEIARGLMHRPKVLFLDEPTLGLDPQSRDHIWKYIDRLAREHGISLMLTTHYMEEAERLCDHVAIIDGGRIVAFDSPDNLKRQVGGDQVILLAPAADEARLRAVPWIKDVAHDGARWQLTVTDASAHLPDILAAAGAVTSVTVHSPTLEDVFMQYTGREMREDAAEGGWAERSMRYR